MSAELHWFPIYVTDWMTSSAISAMTPEQEGVYFRLLLVAWGDGSREPYLEADDQKLAAWSRLGARWKKVGGPVRAEFIERDGRLYNVRLSEIWAEQQAKHESTVARASAGGKAKAAKHGKKGRASSTATGSASGTAPGTASGSTQAVLGECFSPAELELEEAVETPSGFLPASAPADAPAPEGARASAPTARHDEPAPVRYGSAVPVQFGQVVEALEQQSVERAYYAALQSHVARYQADHPDDVERLTIAVKHDLGIPTITPTNSKVTLRLIEDELRVRIVEATGFPPSADEWVAQEGHLNGASEPAEPQRVPLRLVASGDA